jgi:hypothetical protein
MATAIKEELSLFKKLLVLTVSAAAMAFAVSLVPMGASADVIYICPHGVHNHKYCKREVKCVVPQLRGDSRGRARRALLKHDCRLGKVKRIREKHSSVKHGHVLFSKPPKHAIRDRGTKVEIFLRK